MDPLTAFFSTTIAGNLILGLVTEATADRVLSFWDRLDLGNHDLQNALAEAYTSTFKSLEVSMTPKGAFKKFFHKAFSGELFKTRGEKELAGDFQQKILEPFFEKKGMNEKQQEKFLEAARKACRFYINKQDEVMNLEEVFNNVKSGETGAGKALMNDNARQTFSFIEAILFSGQDLKDAPNLEKARNSASEALYKRLENAGGDEVRKFFSDAGFDENTFYEFLRENGLLLNGFIFHLELAIKSNQKVANILQEYRTQEIKKQREKAKIKKRDEKQQLNERIDKIEKAIKLTRETGLDASALQAQLTPLKQELSKIDLILKRTESWERVIKQINDRIQRFERHFGAITQKLDILTEMVEKHDEKLDNIIDITTDTKDKVSETLEETRKTKGVMKALSEDVKFLKELVQGFKKDTAMGDVQKQNLLAGIHADAGFNIHSIYDFKESPEDEIGRGAVGVVYKATHRGAGKQCALKLLKPEYRRDQVIVTRFLREGVILRDLKHPNLVRVEEVGGGGDNLSFYIEMELLQGKTLRKIIDEKALPRDWQTLKAMTQQLLYVVELIHKNGIIHRDLNPNNIMIANDGTLKLMDFGVARIVGLGGLTLQGQVVGTSSYMSPEQRRGEKLDYRSDIYALGLVLYELYTYRVPERDMRSVRRYNPEAPEWLDAVLCRCLAPDKSERFTSTVRLRKIFEGGGADPDDVKRYEDHYYIYLEDGKISRREKRKLEELRTEMMLPQSVYERIEERTRTRAKNDRLKEGIEALEEGDNDFALECFSAVLRLDPENKKAKEGMDKIQKFNLPRQEKAEPVMTVPTPSTPTPVKPSTVVSTATLVKTSTTPVKTTTEQWQFYDELIKISGHKGAVKTVHFIDNNTLVTTGTDRLVKVWSLDNDKNIEEFNVGSPVNAARITHDKTQIAIAKSDWTVSLINLTNGATTKTMTGHVEPVHDIAFTKDGKTMATASGDTTVRIWNVETGGEIRRLKAHNGLVRALAFSKDGMFLLSGGVDRSAILWNVATGEKIWQKIDHRTIITNAAFAANFAVTASTDGNVHFRNVDNGSILKTINAGNGVQSLTFTTDEKFMITGGADKIIRIFNLEEEDEVKRLIGHSGAVNKVALSPDNQIIASCAICQKWDDNQIRLWGQKGDQKEDPKTIDLLKSSLGKSIAIEVEPIRPEWEKWGEMETVGEIDAGVSAFCVFPDFKSAMVGCNDATIRIIDTETGKEKNRIGPLPGKIPQTMTATPDSKYVFAGYYDGTIMMFDVKFTEEVKTFRGHVDAIIAIRTTNDGKILISGSNNGTVRIWDITTGKQLRRIDAHKGAVRTIAVSPNNKYIATSGNDKNVKIWGLINADLLHTIQCHRGLTFGIKFNKTGNLIITAGQDPDVKFWNVETGKEVKSIRTGVSFIQGIDLSNDDKYLVLSGIDKTIRIVDLEKDEEVKKLIGHSGAVKEAFISPGNSIIISRAQPMQWDKKPVKIWCLKDDGANEEVIKDMLSESVKDNDYSLQKSFPPTPDWQSMDEKMKLGEKACNVVAVMKLKEKNKIIAASGTSLDTWDFQTGKKTSTLPLKACPNINTAVMSNDNRLIITGHIDGSMRVINLDENKVAKIIRGHAGTITSIDITNDKRFAVTSTSLGVMRTWDLKFGKSIRQKQIGMTSITATLSRDNKLVLVGCADKTAKVIDFVTGEIINILEGHTSTVTAVAISGDSKCAITGGGDATIRLWNIKNGEEVKKIIGCPGMLKTIEVLPGGRFIISAGFDKVIRIWDIEKEDEVGKLIGHSGVVNSVVVSADLSSIISAGQALKWDVPIRIWNSSKKDHESTDALKSLENAVNKAIDVLTSYDDENQLPDWSSCKELAKVEDVKSVISQADFTPGGHLVCGGNDKTLRMFEVPSLNLLKKIDMDCNIDSLAISADGDKALIGGSDFSLTVVSLADGKVIKRMYGHVNRILSIAMFRNSSLSAAASASSLIRIWDVENGNEIRRFPLPSRQALSVDVSPDNKTIAACGMDRNIYVYDVMTGKLITTLKGHNGPVRCVRITPDCRFLISSALDNTIRMWSIENFNESNRIDRCGNVSTLAVTRDNQFLITGGDDKTVRIFDLKTGKEINKMIGHSGQLKSVTISHDGRYIASAALFRDWDVPLRIWGS